MSSDKSKPPCVHKRQVVQDGEFAGAAEAHGPCDECKAEGHRALIYRLKLIAGLLMPFALQALDVTM